jgi:hypothetical protein
MPMRLTRWRKMSLSDLAIESGLDEDTLLRRLAEILDIETMVPEPDYRADIDMRVFWDKLGVLINVGRDHLDQERLHSVLLSRVMRELRRDLGVAGARTVLQGYLDTMEQGAEGDR